MNVSPVLRWSLMLLVVIAAAIVASATASGARPCGEVVVDDWLDNGRIDRIYDLECYHAAIDRIPAELKDYTDAEEVIGRALQAATGGRLAAGGEDPTPDVAPTGTTPTTTAPPGQSPDSTGGRETAPDLEPAADASAVPVPLVILACLSLVLLAGGAVGHVARRRRGSS